MTHDDAGPSVASAGSHAELRERFAAAALTGLLSKTLCPEEAMSTYVRIAAAYADAMLRELKQTDHGAAPAARARTDGGSVGTDKAEPLTHRGTGDTLSPIAGSESDSPQAVASEAEIDALEYVVHQGIIGAYDRPVLLAWLARLQRTPAEPSAPGEGTRQAGCTLTDAERFVLREVCAAYADRDDVASNEIAAVIDGLLERTKG